MARQVSHRAEIPATKKFGSKYGGRQFKRYDTASGRGAKARLQRAGKRLKRDGQIRQYRTTSYEHVGRNNRTVHVLWIR